MKRQRQSRNLGGPSHPLLITHVVAEVMSYLSFSQLKSCRQVCREWRIASAKYFLNQAMMVFDSEQKLAEFLDLYSDETSARFKNCKFTNSDISPLSTTLDKFLNGFGRSFIKSIYFENFDFAVGNVSYQFEILDKISGMEEIILDCREIPPGRINAEIPGLRYANLKTLRCAFALRDANDTTALDGFSQTVMNILYFSPNIETISTFLKSERKRRNNYPLELYLPNRSLLRPPILQRAENSTNADFLMAMMLSTIVGARRTDLIQRLVHFDLNFHLRRDHLRVLKTLPLKTLNFVFKECRLPGEDAAPNLVNATKQFFNHASRRNLETLKVTIARNQPVAESIGIYDFSSLRNLAIHGGTAAPHFNFMLGCPELETLHLAQCILPRDIDEILMNSNMAKLKTLILHDVKIRGSVAGPQIIATRICTEFLQLKKLKIDQLRDPAFSLICKTLEQLEELIVLKSNLTDHGVTGLSKRVLKKMSGREVIKSRNRPYIGSLKNLRKLEIGSPNLSDASVLYGILDCSSLKSLTIFCPKLSGKGLRSIVNKMDLLALRTICCYEVADSALKYARLKMDNPENVILNFEKGPKSSAQKAKVVEKYSVNHLYMSPTD